jgi:hypothetical protein
MSWPICKEYYVRNCCSGIARPDVARCTPDLVPQPELGVLPKRRDRFNPGDSARSAFAWENLSGVKEDAAAAAHEDPKHDGGWQQTPRTPQRA